MFGIEDSCFEGKGGSPRASIYHLCRSSHGYGPDGVCMPMNMIAENIWVIEGDVVRFYGLSFSTRMTVIRLANGELWVHSPIALNPQLQQNLELLGPVCHLIAPNKFHHLYLPDWIATYPRAKAYAAPGLIKKRSDISFSKELGDSAESVWHGEIGQLIFQGSSAMEEVVFFHMDSKTLILTDLIENYKEESFVGWKINLARMAGLMASGGKTPAIRRLGFVFGKAKARLALSTMLSWQPENIIVAHGECIMGHGMPFLKQSFSWLSGK